MNSQHKAFPIIMSISAFALSLIMLIFVATPIQIKLGMAGVAITEILLLTTALIFAFLSKQNLREIFPFSKPSAREIGGTLVLWLGSYITVLLVTLVLTYFFPKMAEVSQGMSGLFSSVPLVLTVLIAAVLPAFCEEALNRGIVLHGLKAIRSDWLRITVMGLLFGLFHLDPYRFLPTALLGAVLTYIMVKTQNMWLPILLHFVNNFFSTVVGSLSSEVSSAASVELTKEHVLLSVASFLIIGAAIPFLFLLGDKLIKPKTDDSMKKWKLRRVLIATGISVVFFASGIVLIATSPVPFI